MESSLYLLVPLSVAFVFLIGWVFWRALRGGQFDDLERPGYSILNDETPHQGQTTINGPSAPGEAEAAERKPGERSR